MAEFAVTTWPMWIRRILQDTLSNLDAATTLFIICSKSFRTEETLANGLAARAWMLDSGATVTDLDKHFLAVTSNLRAAREFGIPAENCLPMWDWVGGRYSVWSAVGLSCAIAVGWERFAQFLAGAEAMDRHFRSSDPQSQYAAADESAGTVVLQFSRGKHARRAALRPQLAAFTGLSAAIDDGEQRQTREHAMVDHWITPPDRYCGAQPAPWASTPFTSCCTRDNCCARWISYCH